MRRNRQRFTRVGQITRRGNTREVRIILTFASLCLLETATAQTEIAQPASAKRELRVTEIPQEKHESETNRAACKKRYRDAIDAIDAEIGREYSLDKGGQYKQRLLILTRKLRQC